MNPRSPRLSFQKTVDHLAVVYPDAVHGGQGLDSIDVLKGSNLWRERK